MHNRHKHEKEKQVDRKQRYMDVICNQSEQGRHQTGAYIGESHLYANDCLRFVSAKMSRRGVDNAGIDRRAAKPYQDKPHGSGNAAKWYQQGDNSQQNNCRAQPNHLHIAEFQRQKTTERPAAGDADVEQGGILCRRFRRITAKKRQIAACPETGSLFQGTVTEKSNQNCLSAGNGDNLF